MAWYRAGSVNVTNGSNAVTGVSTAFIANARVGDAFVGPDGLTYEITNIASNTALSIFPPYRSATAANQAYAIQPVQGYTKTLADRASQLIDTLDKPWNSAEDAAEARSDLGLGSAATRDVGTVSGRLLEYNAFGLGLKLRSLTAGSADLLQNPIAPDESGACSFIYSGFQPANRPTGNYFAGFYLRHSTGGGQDYATLFGFVPGVRQMYYRHKMNGAWEANYIYLRDSNNTTVDSNGFIKAASPVIKLFADKISSNEQASQQKPKFIKNGIGDYTITGTSGLAKEGWWIETPKDSNGNTKVIIQELDEVGQPDGTFNINIKTTEPRYGLDETGRLIGIGDPYDIPVGRWIDIRLNELPVEDEQPAEEPEPHSAE